VIRANTRRICRTANPYRDVSAREWHWAKPPGFLDPLPEEPKDSPLKRAALDRLRTIGETASEAFRFQRDGLAVFSPKYDIFLPAADVVVFKVIALS
jgi:hypothetical protein